MSYTYLSAIARPGPVLLLALLSATLPLAAAAASPEAEIELLKRQVLDLQERVKRLEGEVAEGVPVNVAREVQPVPGGWRKSHNWTLLDEGMTAFRVKEILGEPDRERSVKKFDFWYYGDAKVSLYLRRLNSWDVPEGLDSD